MDQISGQKAEAKALITSEHLTLSKARGHLVLTTTLVKCQTESRKTLTLISNVNIVRRGS
jgi:hypothetical protein